MEVITLGNYASNQMNDFDVVKRVIAGEKALFEILLRRYNQTLYRVIRGYLHDQDEVQDAMQNVYLKAFDKLYQFKGNSTFSTWLIRIGINEALLRLKEIKRANILYLNPGEGIREIVNQIPDKQMNPEKSLIRQEAKQLLEKAIDDLPEKYRIIYILKEVEGLDNAQVAASLELSDSNVKVRLHRAKNLLKESLLKFSVHEQVFEFGNIQCDGVVHFVMQHI